MGAASAGHDVSTVLVSQRSGSPLPWFWTARCRRCGDVGDRHDITGEVDNDDAYRRARADMMTHQAHPDGSVLIVGGAEVWLR